MATKILEVNAVKLAYDDFGDTPAETIVLIAGLGTQMVRWTVPFCQELAARGYRVIRFDNGDVHKNIDSVVEAIRTACESGSSPSPRPSPAGRGSGDRK